MEENNTLQNWTADLEKKIKESNLLSFSLDSSSIRIMKDDFISLFNDAIKGGTFKMCKLENFTSLSQAISSYEKDHTLIGNELFTDQNEKTQQEIFKLIKEKQDESIKKTTVTNAYLGFGILKYNLDVFASATLQAPMVFIPINISYDEENDSYSFKALPGEVYLNTVLLSRIKKVRRVDLSYPIDSNFSISDFLYYISIKIQSLNWNLLNHVFIGNFDLFSYDDYLEIKENQQLIQENEIVKKISYFNSQFYQFKTRGKKPLNSKYLSILDMDNDEYSILKRVASKENLFIRTNDERSKIHLISNTILTYCLNNLKTLIVYADNNEKEELLHHIDDQGYSRYVCDLNPASLDKATLLSDIANYDNHLLPYSSKRNTLVEEDLKEYYAYKNNYKRLTNLLRSVENPTHISLNKLVNEYYKLDKYPLINITLREPNRLTVEDLSRYLDYVVAFSNTITKLGCRISEHPFYGFSRRVMRKNDYLELKEHVSKLSALTNDISTLIDVGVKKYHYPRPNNLKEIKALLNVLNFVDTYKGKVEWINDPKLRDNFNDISSLRRGIEVLNEQRDAQLDKYTRKIQFISEDLVNEYLLTKAPKLKAKIRKLLGKQVSLDDVDIIVDELDAYFKGVKEIKERTSHHDEEMVLMMKENRLNELEVLIKEILKYRSSLAKISNKNDFDASKIILDKNRNRLISRKALQNAYNKMLESTKIIQKYFDIEIYNFNEYPLNEFEKKVTKMSTTFSSINDYTDYYKSLIETNDFIPNLGNELIRAGVPEDFKNIFMKKLYYDIANERIISNKLLKENTRQKLYEELEKFSSSDIKRKEMITGVISSNIDAYLKRNLLRLRHDESEPIYSLFSKNPKLLTINMICEKAKESLYNIKPIIMVPYSLVSKFLKDKIFNYDVCIFLPRKHMRMIDVLPSFVHSDSTIVFDEEFVTSDPRKVVKYEVEVLNDYFLDNAKHSYHISQYQSDIRNIIIHNSPLDAYTKHHVAKVLQNHGFEVRVDYPIKTYVIDILVRVPRTKNIIAIEFNHLPYNAPEDTYKSFLLEDSIISDLGFIPYRLFTVSYFFNEEMENKELIDYIVKKSNIIAEEKTKKKQVLLMDYLFAQYVDPHLVYYKIDKEHTPLEDIVMTIIKECSPIAVNDLVSIVEGNIRGIIKKLVNAKKITLEDGFIYLVDAPIEFRRVSREEKFIRPIKYVSKKEIYDAIYRIVKNQVTIDQEVIVKMILLSLGYKKMNKESYEYVLNCIEFLLKEKIIFNNGTLLCRDLI